MCMSQMTIAKCISQNLVEAHNDTVKKQRNKKKKEENH